MDEWTSFAGKLQQVLRRIFVGRKPKKKCGKSHSSVIYPQLFFALNQTIQSTEEVRTNSMENNIQHRCKYCLDSWTIVLEMLFYIGYH